MVGVFSFNYSTYQFKSLFTLEFSYRHSPKIISETNKHYQIWYITFGFIEDLGDLTTPYLHLKSLNRDILDNQGWRKWKPFLCFDYIIVTHQFHPTYYRKLLSKDRIRLHKEIMILYNKGWGYTKIHRHLIKNGFGIGKSRTTVDSIIKKIKKREKFLSQPITDGIGNFRVLMMEVKYNRP